MGWWVDGGSHRINFDAKRAVQNTDCPESDHDERNPSINVAICGVSCRTGCQGRVLDTVLDFWSWRSIRYAK